MTDPLEHLALHDWEVPVREKFAVTDLLEDIDRVQAPLPEHSPLQEVKVHP